MMENKPDRRKFIINIYKGIATILGTTTIGKYLSYAPRTSTIKPGYNSARSGSKLLIAYESQFGSTAEIARFISKSLVVSDVEIEVKKIDEITDLSPYNVVIIGSAIQYDNWMEEAREFIVINENELSTKSVSFFLVCLALSKQTEKATQKSVAYADKISNLVPKVEVKNFGKFSGVLDYSKMSFVQRIMAKGIFAFIGIKEGDYRDWDLIRKWSSELKL